MRFNCGLLCDYLVDRMAMLDISGVRIFQNIGTPKKYMPAEVLTLQFSFTKQSQRERAQVFWWWKQISKDSHYIES